MESIFDNYKLFRKIENSFKYGLILPSRKMEYTKDITIENFKELAKNKDFMNKFLDMEMKQVYCWFDYYLVGEAFMHMDYDNFCAFLDDMFKIDSPQMSETFLHSRGLNLIEAILSCDYRNMPAIRQCFNLLILKASPLIFDDRDFFEKILDEMIKLNIDKNSYKDDSLSEDDYNKVLNDRVAYLLEPSEKMMYYSALLLTHDRYYYFNEKIYEVEDNENIRNDILSKINTFSAGLFNELNDSCEEDSFKACMDIVFDSDSYSELNSKLDSIVRASIKYESGRMVEALAIINELDSDKHKQVYCDEVVAYSTNTMNLIAKPKRIIDRMKYLYNRIDSSISYAFMDDMYTECDTVSNLISSINSHIKKEKSPFKMLIKKFVKVK